ncbi:MAG: HAD family phosphatase [Acidobacteriaceae bacterium]|nr:HAD family phosphatase [Acidobacteriaceae bacterium]
MPIAIKGLIFDYGNVLCEPQRVSDLQTMARILQMSKETFEPIYWTYRVSYDASKMTAREYWEQVASDAHRTLQEEDITALRKLDVDSWSLPSPVMINFAERSRKAGLRTAVLSNMPMDLRLSVANWLPQFDHSTYSCDVGMCKPDPAIYRHCLDGLATAANETLFLDDRPENVRAARELGIQSILFTTAAEAGAMIGRDFSLPVAIEC